VAWSHTPRQALQQQGLRAILLFGLVVPVCIAGGLTTGLGLGGPSTWDRVLGLATALGLSPVFLVVLVHLSRPVETRETRKGPTSTGAPE
jgi:hypothetical protein